MAPPLDSFDSSLPSSSHHPAHLTLGSLASSFHDPDRTGQLGLAGLGGRPVPLPLEYGSLLDETESGVSLSVDGHGDGDVLPPSLAAPRPASSSARTASSSTRLKASTSPPTTARSTPVPAPAQEEESEVDEAALRALELSNERWSGAGKGKKKDRAGGGGTQHMTLREQEKVIDEFKKENFDLKLKIHFYEERLARLAPDQIDLALRENVQLKVEFQGLRTELKKYKRLLLDGNRVIEGLGREREDWDARRGALEAEVKELRRRREGEYEGEDARAEISRLRSELDAERLAREDALGEAENLRHALGEARDGLGDSLVSVSEGGRRGRDKETRRELEALRRKVDELEQLNTSQRSQITAQVTMLSTRNDEKEALKDEVEALKQDRLQLEAELEHLERVQEREERREVGQEGGDKSKEELERENDAYRDRVSFHALEVDRLEALLDEKEKEIEELLEDLDRHKDDHAEEMKALEEEWREEVDSARRGLGEAKEALEEKEAEAEELSQKIESLLHELATKDAEMKADSEEVEALTDDLKQLGAQIFTLEEEVEAKDARIEELENELNAVDKELEDKQAVHDQVVDALKEKLSTTKSRLSETTIQHESALTEAKFLREKIESLALRLAELEENARADLETRRRLEDAAEELVNALHKEEEERDLDQEEWGRQRKEEEARWQKVIDGKTRDAQQAQTDLAQTKALLAIREQDLQRLQAALNSLEGESRRLGESHTHDRFSLEGELERLKRDLGRYEEDLRRERAEADKAREALRDREAALAAATSDSRELTTQLATQTQTRLTLTEKLDATSKTLRDAQRELASAKERVRIAEDQLNSDQRTQSRSENHYRDQLTERNTLLLTVYQYIDKIVSTGDRTPRKPGQSDPKPFTNFSVFHDSLISRLKSVNQIQASFDRRTKEIEAKFGDQFASLKRQQESRLRQLDRFETSIKTATDTQRQWRQRVNSKQIELDAAKATSVELQAQIASLRQRAFVAGVDPGTSAKMSVLTTRASTAERRLAATQAQLTSAEEKLGEARTKIGIAEGKWEARLRELEARLHAAEEKVKRERLGAKERMSELSNEIKNLEGQVTGAKRRDAMLDDVILASEEATKRPPLP